jgi:dihydrofolate synthase / folylpolyglutamate synthase
MSIANMENTYNDALDYLYGFVDYSLTRQLRYSEEKFNLDRIKKLMNLLGNPQFTYPVIHVAGTKGKGSTAAFIASVLQTAGYKIGLYTSPHLHDYTERIQINRIPISHDSLVDEVEYVKKLLPEVPEITTFEITTAIAFRFFAENQVDVAVIEVGLGGRLDATNIVDPIISVITSLSYDHMNILGDTIEKIAAEKAGIIKDNRPVVIAPQVYKQVYPVIEQFTDLHHSSLLKVEEIFEFYSSAHSLNGQDFSIHRKGNSEKPQNLSLRLLGFHQVENAATAFCTLDELKQLGFRINNDQILEGFAKTYWPCRFEVVSNSPLTIIDSAHNADSAQKLSNTIREYLGNNKITLIFGVSEDKDVNGMLDYLLPISDVIIMTKSIHPRAMSPQQLKLAAEEYGRSAYECETIEEALKVARELKKDNTMVITGSLFVAAAAKEIIQNQNQDK